MRMAFLCSVVVFVAALCGCGKNTPASVPAARQPQASVGSPSVGIPSGRADFEMPPVVKEDARKGIERALELLTTRAAREVPNIFHPRGGIASATPIAPETVAKQLAAGLSSDDDSIRAATFERVGKIVASAQVGLTTNDTQLTAARTDLVRSLISRLQEDASTACRVAAASALGDVGPHNLKFHKRDVKAEFWGTRPVGIEDDEVSRALASAKTDADPKVAAQAKRSYRRVTRAEL